MQMVYSRQKNSKKLKVNEKIMAMRLLIYCRSGQRTYKEAKENFRKKMTQLLGCKLRALKEYLTALKALFYIGHQGWNVSHHYPPRDCGPRLESR